MVLFSAQSNLGRSVLIEATARRAPARSIPLPDFEARGIAEDLGSSAVCGCRRRKSFAFITAAGEVDQQTPC